IYQQNLIEIETDSNNLLGQPVDTKDQEEDNDDKYEKLDEANIEFQNLGYEFLIKIYRI
ncbi:21211_t:CDS:1, partial [Cetraspora pellucida]